MDPIAEVEAFATDVVRLLREWFEIWWDAVVTLPWNDWWDHLVYFYWEYEEPLWALLGGAFVLYWYFRPRYRIIKPVQPRQAGPLGVPDQLKDEKVFGLGSGRPIPKHKPKR